MYWTLTVKNKLSKLENKRVKEEEVIYFRRGKLEMKVKVFFIKDTYRNIKIFPKNGQSLWKI